MVIKISVDIVCRVRRPRRWPWGANESPRGSGRPPRAETGGWTGTPRGINDSRGHAPIRLRRAWTEQRRLENRWGICPRWMERSSTRRIQQRRGPGRLGREGNVERRSKGNAAKRNEPTKRRTRWNGADASMGKSHDCDGRRPHDRTPDEWNGRSYGRRGNDATMESSPASTKYVLYATAMDVQWSPTYVSSTRGI